MTPKRNHGDEWTAPKRRLVRTWHEPNAKGETIVVDFTRCEGGCEKGSLPRLWKKAGYIDRVLETWWSVDVYCYDGRGGCRSRYNPTVKPGGGGYVLDFDWVLEGTPENMEAISREIERRAFA